MKRWFVVAMLLSLFSACANSFMLHNRQNLAQLNYGMTKEELNGVMGTESTRSYNNPYRTAFQLRQDGKQVEVYYYWTDNLGTPGITDDELTPVVLVDGKVAGWGREFWADFVTKYEIRVKNL